MWRGDRSARTVSGTCTALLVLLAAILAISKSALAEAPFTSTGDPRPDEVAYFGESVSSLNQWPRSTAWGISYRKTFAPYFAASLAYLNDGHFPGHHRDGVTFEGWIPINFHLLSMPVTVSAGLGPFYYYDTVFAPNSSGYADAHAWTWLGSVDVIVQPWSSGPLSHLVFEGRIDHTAPERSIETTSIGAGFGYRGISDFVADPDSAKGFAKNEVVASYWKTVTNSFSSGSQTARAQSIEYRRRQIWREFGVSVGFLNEGDTQLIRRNGVTAEGWAEPSFHSDLWSIGFGFGFYSAIDKYRPSPGRHVSDVASATVSLRPTKNFAIRFLWHRIVTDYDRDTDVVLLGLACRF